jgi:hypothetical protein
MTGDLLRHHTRFPSHNDAPEAKQNYPQILPDGSPITGTPLTGYAPVISRAASNTLELLLQINDG